MNNVFYQECSSFMSEMKADSVDLTVTSPPYSTLRKYEGYKFDFMAVARGLYRVTKPGGIVCWNVSDKIVDYDRQLESFRQGLGFQKFGFKMYDIIVENKLSSPFPRYHALRNLHEFVFVLSKGKPLTFNPPLEDVKHRGKMTNYRKGDRNEGKRECVEFKIMNPTKVKGNVWTYATGKGHVTSDEIAYEHPALMHEELVTDLINAFSNPNELVFDPMCGSGTTLKMAKRLGRRWLGTDMSEKYVRLARRRLAIE